jgi:hypothetical protein
MGLQIMLAQNFSGAGGTNSISANKAILIGFIA